MATFVLVPGFWLGGWAWRAVARSLQTNAHEVYAVTLTGLGEKKHLSSSQVDLDTHMCDVFNLIEYEGLSDVILVGHGYAGLIITAVADRLAPKLAKLVYVDTAPLPNGVSLIDFYPPDMPAEQAAGAAMFKWFVTPPPANARYIAPIAMPAGFNPETNFINTVQEMFEIYQDFDARTVGLSFAVPVFIFQGEMDINTPVSLARDYLDDIEAPVKVFATIPGAGHNTLAFAPEMLALLDEHVRAVATGK